MEIIKTYIVQDEYGKMFKVYLLENGDRYAETSTGLEKISAARFIFLKNNM